MSDRLSHCSGPQQDVSPPPAGLAASLPGPGLRAGALLPAPGPVPALPQPAGGVRVSVEGQRGVAGGPGGPQGHHLRLQAEAGVLLPQGEVRGAGGLSRAAAGLQELPGDGRHERE